MKASIDRIIERFGEAVEYTPQGGTMIVLRASVQLPVADAIVNDFDLTGFIIYIRTGDVPAMPQKFDRIKVRGLVRGIEEVQEERLNDVPLVYVMRVRG
jgi:hypothetical protein